MLLLTYALMQLFQRSIEVVLIDLCGFVRDDVACAPFQIRNYHNYHNSYSGCITSTIKYIPTFQL